MSNIHGYHKQRMQMAKSKMPFDAKYDSNEKELWYLWAEHTGKKEM